MKNILIIWLLLCCNVPVFSQDTDSLQGVKYNFDYVFKDGIYLTLSDMLNNKPIPYSSTDINPDEDVRTVLPNMNSIVFFNTYGTRQSISPYELWGFCYNGKPYIKWNQGFYLLPYIGTVTHFIANVTVVHETYSDPFYNSYYYSMTPDRYYTSELRQLLLDTRNGEIRDFSIPVVEDILSSDSFLHDEFVDFSKRRKRKVMFFYLRKFNERQPLYMPENE